MFFWSPAASAGKNQEALFLKKTQDVLTRLLLVLCLDKTRLNDDSVTPLVLGPGGNEEIKEDDEKKKMPVKAFLMDFFSKYDWDAFDRHGKLMAAAKNALRKWNVDLDLDFVSDLPSMDHPLSDNGMIFCVDRISPFGEWEMDDGAYEKIASWCQSHNIAVVMIGISLQTESGKKVIVPPNPETWALLPRATLGLHLIFDDIGPKSLSPELLDIQSPGYEQSRSKLEALIKKQYALSEDIKSPEHEEEKEVVPDFGGAAKQPFAVFLEDEDSMHKQVVELFFAPLPVKLNFVHTNEEIGNYDRALVYVVFLTRQIVTIDEKSYGSITADGGTKNYILALRYGKAFRDELTLDRSVVPNWFKPTAIFECQYFKSSDESPPQLLNDATNKKTQIEQRRFAREVLR